MVADDAFLRYPGAAVAAVLTVTLIFVGAGVAAWYTLRWVGGEAVWWMYVPVAVVYFWGFCGLVFGVLYVVGGRLSEDDDG